MDKYFLQMMLEN